MLLFDLDSGKLLKSFFVFNGVRVHGICCNFTSCEPGPASSKLVFMIAVFGETRLKLFKLEIEASQKMQADLVLICLFPKFVHWILDIYFLKDFAISPQKQKCLLAIGFSNNSLGMWDIETSRLIHEVCCPDKCLLYSMRLRGEEEGVLYIASGTIFNEIIIWKVILQYLGEQLEHFNGKQTNSFSLVDNSEKRHLQLLETVVTHKLLGHEGSIFRIAWSDDGCRLISVSDDRSARLWAVHPEHSSYTVPAEPVSISSVGPVLFGHNARVWDCSIFDAVITAGEDGTCRIWDPDGRQLKIVKEHIGRGIWRCLYDPSSSLLLTAGFDSAIKMHLLQDPLTCSMSSSNEENKMINYDANMFTICIPDSSNHTPLMDSNSEYVRRLHLAHTDVLYVATNRGYLYHAMLLSAEDVRWTHIFKACDNAPIICMDYLDRKSDELSGEAENWIAIGDGKGKMTVLQVNKDHCAPEVGTTFSWPAEGERQLLGTYWCKVLGSRYTFTSDPRGTLKSWRLCNDVAMHQEFTSHFGARIMCLDVSLDKEVLVCGDLRGNVLLFPLLVNNLESMTKDSIPPLCYFAGAHGISTICQITIHVHCSNKIEICSAGGDGCICYMEYKKDTKLMEFVGMKHVKELSSVEDILHSPSSFDDWQSYVVGFASSNFVVCNLLTESKVLEVPCGGWRRPHSYCLSVLPETIHAFAYVKDELIYLSRQSEAENRFRMPRNLRPQFHGREVHSLCFINQYSPFDQIGICKPWIRDCWIATGSEDGTVRLSRYGIGVGNWQTTELLGEHVAGSAIRSLCFVSDVYTISPLKNSPWGNDLLDGSLVKRESPRLLISAGAKRVMTLWLLADQRRDKVQDSLSDGIEISSKFSSTISFKWLSSDIPMKYSCCKKPENSVEVADRNKMQAETSLDSENVNDWRYLAVTAFLVGCTLSRIFVCFVVVACSNATLMLRAFVLPYRLWYDVASLIPLSSPILALQHVVIPMAISCEDKFQISSMFILISGSTDGSIMFWDISASIRSFVQWISALCKEAPTVFQKRPKTGRGSQGGRSYKLSKGVASKNKAVNGVVPTGLSIESNGNCQNYTPDRTSSALGHYLDKSTTSTQHKVKETAQIFDIDEVKPLHVFNHVHQSGINSLHVAEFRRSQNSGSGTLYVLPSGGDDQSFHWFVFKLVLVSEFPYSNVKVEILHEGCFISAHSSAIKGIWTDGKWVFSTGLDQRVRCWKLKDNGECSEFDHLVLSVPEPEALDAKPNGLGSYQIAVAGRGMQMVEFYDSHVHNTE